MKPCLMMQHTEQLESLHGVLPQTTHNLIWHDPTYKSGFGRIKEQSVEITSAPEIPKTTVPHPTTRFQHIEHLSHTSLG
eukprot:3740546-Amphidinium_carterae.1